MIYSLGNITPKIQDKVFIAPNAAVIGNVILKKNASVWFNAVIRGDTDLIQVGENSNIQDGCVLHTDEGISLIVGDNVTVGHKVMLHGCKIGNGSLIGINSVILNGAVIGKNCLIGANSLITEGKSIPDNSLVMGSPGKIIRTLKDEEIRRMHKGAIHYVANGQEFLQNLKLVDN